MKPGAGTWEILQTSIGQGTTQITPLHNAMITAAIANGGTLMKPYFLDSVVSAGDETIKKFMPAAYGSLMSAKEAAGLTELMRAVVTEEQGLLCVRMHIRWRPRQDLRSLRQERKPTPGSPALRRLSPRGWW